jgi:hypothetical protein
MSIRIDFKILVWIWAHFSQFSKSPQRPLWQLVLIILSYTERERERALCLVPAAMVAFVCVLLMNHFNCGGRMLLYGF